VVTRNVALAGFAVACVAVSLTSAAAAPPPPPPSYVFDVAHLLTQKEDAGTIAKLAHSVADDVQVYVNGQRVAGGKAAWMQQRAGAEPRAGGLLAYSEGWQNGGSLMIVDQFDTVNSEGLRQGSVADPRFGTRTTLYQFARDGKIHEIDTVVADGFWIKP
jgi:hypothetical protein